MPHKKESNAALLTRLTRELAKPRVTKSVREEGKKQIALWRPRPKKDRNKQM